MISYFIDTAEDAHQFIEAYVGADQLVIANVVGEETKALLGDSGKVCIINGKEGKTDFVQRSEGFRKSLEAPGSKSWRRNTAILTVHRLRLLWKLPDHLS